MKTVNYGEKKYNKPHTETPRLKFMLILVAATSVLLCFPLTPWTIVPTLVTEDVSVIAVSDYDRVVESVLGHFVVVTDCGVAPGDIISATFYVPAMEQNGYYDRIEDKLAMVNN